MNMCVFLCVLLFRENMDRENIHLFICFKSFKCQAFHKMSHSETIAQWYFGILFIGLALHPMNVFSLNKPVVYCLWLCFWLRRKCVWNQIVDFKCNYNLNTHVFHGWLNLMLSTIWRIPCVECIYIKCSCLNILPHILMYIYYLYHFVCCWDFLYFEFAIRTKSFMRWWDWRQAILWFETGKIIYIIRRFLDTK